MRLQSLGAVCLLVGCAGTPRPAVANPDGPTRPSASTVALSEALGRHDAILLEAGFRRVRDGESFVLEDHPALISGLETDARPWVLVAAGSAAVGGLNVEFFDGDASPLGAARGGRDVVLGGETGCSGHAVLRTASGQGRVAWALYAGDVGLDANTRRRLNAQPALSSEMLLHLQERGWVLLEQHEISAGASVIVPFRLEAGRCATVVAVGEAGTESAVLALHRGDERLAQGGGDDALLQSCAGGELELHVDGSRARRILVYTIEEARLGGGLQLWNRAR